MGFFKAYDMRGTFGSDFDLNTVYRVGRALPDVMSGLNGLGAGVRPKMLVGRDCRTTSESVRDALVAGLSSAGAEVSDLGLCTTPMVYCFTATDGYDGSVMVTASHNPSSDNGLKVSMRTSLPVGYANGLCEVERRVAADSAVYSPSASRCTGEEDFRSRYVDWIKSHTASIDFGMLRFAVDCSNGMASLLVRDLFPGAVVLNDEPNGDFPCHSPNPLKADAREQISRMVKEMRLDCGIIFDGDADRAMFVDENGSFVQPDYLIPIVADACAKMSDGGFSRRVLHDVRTSRGVIECLLERGFEPVMVPVGHAFAKPKMRENNAICGGELAGHYYFGDFFGCDSGVLAALRILSEAAAAKARGETFSQMTGRISSRYANSGELNFKVADKDAAIKRVLAAAKSFGEEIGRSEMDGIRLEFSDGWINVRKSNTEPYLRLIVEDRSADGMRRRVAALEKEINAG